MFLVILQIICRIKKGLINIVPPLSVCICLHSLSIHRDESDLANIVVILGMQEKCFNQMIWYVSARQCCQM